MALQRNEVPLNFKLHPKQARAFSSPATELLFGGATRGGKSHLVRVALITWCTWIPGLQCLILRKYYNDVLLNHMESPTGFKRMLDPYIRSGIVKLTENTIRWVETGSLIVLSHCSSEEAMWNNQGVGKHVLVLDEACQLLERHIRMLRGWVTMPEEMKVELPEQLRGRFPRIIYTANPMGPSTGYFRRQFVDPVPEGSIWRAPPEEGGFLRQYLRAKVEDNPSEDADAVYGRIMGLGDENLSDALLNANWESPAGDFFTQFNLKLHRVFNFNPPSWWFKFITFDWGSSEPFCVLWWCVADGTPVACKNGEERVFPRGSLIAYREWYGCNKRNPSEGLEMGNPEVARGIVHRTLESTSKLIITDNLPFQDRGMQKNGKKYNIADVFKENGCPLVLGNTARITGWTQVRDRLVGRDGEPLLYFCQCCKYTLQYMPALERDRENPEDAQLKGEATHCCDAVRLACTTRPIVRDEIKDPEETRQPFQPKPLPTPKEIMKLLKRRQSYGKYYH